MDPEHDRAFRHAHVDKLEPAREMAVVLLAEWASARAHSYGWNRAMAAERASL